MVGISPLLPTPRRVSTCLWVWGFLVLLLNHAQAQYLGSSTLYRRLAPVTFNAAIGTREFELRIEDEVGYSGAVGSCTGLVQSYACLAQQGVCPNIPSLNPSDCRTTGALILAFTSQLLNARAVEGLFSRTFVGDFPQAISGSDLILAASAPDLGISLLDQPPIVNMLPRVYVRAECQTVLRIPIYDSDRFDTVRCILATDPGQCFNRICGLPPGFQLQSTVAIPCQITIAPNGLVADASVSVSLLAIDTSIHGRDMNEVNLQFTITGRAVANCNIPAAGYRETSVFTDTGPLTTLPVQAEFKNNIVYNQLGSNPVVTTRGGQVAIDNVVANEFQLNVEYDEATNPLPESLCLQYDGVNSVPSDVICAFFLPGLAHFGRTSIAGNSGENLRIPIIVEQFAFQGALDLSVVATPLTRAQSIVSLPTPALANGQGNRQMVEMNLLATGNVLEQSMLSISPISGPEAVVYIHPFGSTEYLLDVQLARFVSPNLIMMRVCKSDHLELAAVVYVEDLIGTFGNEALNFFDFTGLNRFRNMLEAYFVIEPTVACSDFSFTVNAQRIPPSGFFNINMHAEGPQRFSSAQRVITLCDVCQNNGICLSTGICDCSGTSFAAPFCSTALLIQFDQTTVNIQESNTVTVEVCLQPRLPRNFPVTIGLAAVGTSTGATTSDLSFPPTATIFAGAVCAPVAINAVQDVIPEADETFQLTLALPPQLPQAAGFNVAGASLSVTIPANDQALQTVGFQSPFGADVNEGVNPVTVMICLSSAASTPVSVSVIATPAGSPDVLFTSPVVIGVGQSCAPLLITAVQDNINEAQETVLFQITATNPTLTIDTNADTFTLRILEQDSVGFDQTAISVVAGSTFPLTVCRTVPQNSNIVVGLTYNFQDPVFQSDLGTFVQIPRTISIIAGQRCGTVNVPTVADSDPTNELFTITLASVSGDGTTIDPTRNIAAVTITVQDLSVFFDPIQQDVTEGQTVDITVCQSQTINQDNAVEIALGLQDQVGPADFNPPVIGPIRLIIPDGQLCATASLLTLNDADTTDETFFVTLTGSDFGITSVAAASVTILATQSIGFLGSLSQVVAESSNVLSRQICVTPPTPVPQAVSIFLSVSPPASLDVQFNQEVTLPAGQTCTDFNTNIVQDGIVELQEVVSFEITGTNPPLTVDTAANVLTLTIAGDDLVGFSQSAISVLAGMSFELEVCRGVLQNLAVTSVVLTYNFASPVFQEDLGPFSQIPLLISIPAGQLCGSVTVPTAADGDIAEETFSIDLVSVSGGGTAIDPARSSVAVTIMAQVFLEFEFPEYIFTVGAPSITVRACFRPRIPQETRVTFFAVSPDPQTFDSGAIEAGNTCGDVTIALASMGRNTDFQSSLLSTDVDPHEATGVANFVATGADIVGFNEVTIGVDEGSTFVLTVCGDITRNVNTVLGLMYNFDGDANVFPTDLQLFGLPPQSILIPIGVLCGSVTIPTEADRDPRDETFTVTLVTASGGTIIDQTRDVVSVTIQVPDLTVFFNNLQEEVIEGDSLTIMVCQSRAINTDNAVVIAVDLQGLVDPSDFTTSVTGTITRVIVADSLCSPLAITTANDADTVRESFGVSFIGSTFGIPSVTTATIIIVPIEDAVLVQLEPLVMSFLEAELGASINLVAQSALLENIIVTIGVTPVTATSLEDFRLVSFMATLPQGTTLIPINLQLIDDALVELDEVLEVSIISSSGNTQIQEGTSTSTITILDNDLSVISIRKPNPGPIPEDAGDVTFDVCASRTLPEPISITVNLVGLSATVNVDVIAQGNPTFSFPAGLADGACIPYIVTILPNDDPADLPLEDFQVVLSNVEFPGVISTNPDEVTITCVIVDSRDGDPAVTGDGFVLTLTPPLDTDDNYLYFVSYSPFDVSATVTLGSLYTETFTIPADGSYVLELPNTVAFPTNPPDLHGLVIRVDTSGLVHLYSHNRRPAGGTGGSTQIYPLRNLGNYYVVTARAGPFYESFVSIASAVDNNMVAIIFSAPYTFNGVYYQPGETALETLAAYQAIYLSSDNDLSGTVIFSSEPLYVSEGVRCNNIPGMTHGWCDLTTEQLLPALSTGTLSVVGPTPGREAYTVHLTAIEDGTVIQFRGETILLDAGDQARRFVCDDPAVHEIASNNPIYVHQFLASFTTDFETGDPAMLVLPPVEDFTGEVSFYVPNVGGEGAITVYILCDQRAGLLLDQVPFDTLGYYVAGGKRWCSVTLLDVSSGRRHTVSHTNANVRFYVAVFNQMEYLQEGSAMSAGFNFGCGDNGFSCITPPTDPCFVQPCFNGGICRRKAGTPNGYFCRCRGDFFGQNCEIDALVCTVSNIVDYVTFDQSQFSIESNCRYTLLTLPGSTMTFIVQIWYDRCPTRGLRLILCFIIGPTRIYFLPSGVVEVNGVNAQFPVNDIPGIQIYRSNRKLVFVSDEGVRVVYDENGNIAVQANRLLAGQTDGLCGNSDRIQNEFDEFAAFGPGAAIAFANSQSDQSLTECILPDPLSPPVIITCNDPTTFNEANQRCLILSDTNGPFAPCNGTVDPSPFVTACAQDVCIMGNLCDNLELYVRACAANNVVIRNWRGVTNCDVSCQSGVYTDCADSCPRTCYFLLSGSCECIDGACFEDCQCPPGYYLSNGRCVLPGSCGCLYQGLYYDIGENYVNADCSQKCTCTARGTFTCEKYACHPNAMCTTVIQGRPICRCAPSYTGDGEVCILDTIKGIAQIEPCYGQQCDGTCFSSPNYGVSNYNNWETRLYVVGAPCATNIRVECLDIGTEDGKDFLHIGPGPDVLDPVCVWRFDIPGVLALTGDTSLPQWDSNDWLLWMYWNTDRSTTERGWECCFYVDDPCRDEPCQNGGTCIKQPNSQYTCKCPRGYGGTDCREVVYYCGSYGDPHYYTFDGLFYDFHGTCDYQLVTGIGSFIIEIVQRVAMPYPNSQVTANEFITINIPNFAIELLQGGATRVNGLNTYLPYVPNNDLSIRTAGQFVVVTITLVSGGRTGDVEVWWNGEHFVEIQWPDAHRGLVNGLCGIPDGDISNDHSPAIGVIIPNDNEFAANFRLPPTCVSNPLPVTSCLGGAHPAILYTQLLCGSALGAFTQCRNSFPNVVASFEDSCLFDGCQTLPNQEYLCDTLQALEHFCQSAGIAVGSWRSGALCGDCCPANSVWNNCAPANPRTCSNPNPVCDRPCTAACQCIDGFIWDNGNCIPETQCGCFASGIYYPRGTTFLNAACNIFSECISDGSVFAEAISCNANQDCLLQNGIYDCVCRGGLVEVGDTCQSDPCGLNPCNGGECLTSITPFNTLQFAGCRCPRGLQGPNCASIQRVCTAFGDPHYRTFDGRFFDFHGRCSYVLAQDGCLTGQQNTFSITASNDLYGKGLTSTNSVTINYRQETIVLNRFGFVSINGIYVTLPTTFIGGTILKVANNTIVLTQEFEVRWNNLFNVDIKVGSIFGLCGLCGNNDGNPANDFISPTGQSLTFPNEFGNSWTDPSVPCPSFGGIPPDPCIGVDEATLSRIETLCDGLRTNTGTCPGLINPDPYIDACIQDGCADPLSEAGSVNSLWVYIEECNSRGIVLDRIALPSGVNPAKACPPNSLFKFTHPECEPSCSSLFGPPELQAGGLCLRPAVPGCWCAEGYVREGNNCVLPTDCGCTQPDNRYYPLDTWWIEPGCTQRCQCQRNAAGVAEANCCDYVCSPNAECGVANGARQCICSTGFFGNGLSCLPTSCTANRCSNGGTCQDLPNGRDRCICRPGTFGETCSQGGALCYIYGDPYFETFDGLRYDLNGVCEYQAVTQCGITNNAPFSITVTLEQVPNEPLSRLAGLTITITDPRTLVYDLRRDGVFRGGATIPLLIPYYSVPDGIEVYQSGRDVWFRTRFFTVRWDFVSKAIIEIRDTFSNTGLCGLCGNYDNLANNDFVTQSGASVTSAEALANSFRVQSCNAAVARPDNPCTTNPANAALADTYCAIILDPFGPFNGCSNVDRNTASGQCRDDVCETGLGEKICSILEVLAHRCLVTNGGPPVEWRPYSMFACPITCPEGASYSNCVPVCGNTCSSSYRIERECNYPCIAGCQCDGPGAVLHDGACIPSADCGCYDPIGNHYPLGSSYLTDNCQVQCTCTRNGFPDCVPTTCGAREQCFANELDGSLSCVCQANFLLSSDGECIINPCSQLNCNSGWCVNENLRTYCVCPQGVTGGNCELQLTACYSYGDPHFRTFDGLLYDFHGPCSYTLVSTTVANQPPILENFRILQHNEFVPGGQQATTTGSISVMFSSIGANLNNNYISLYRDGRVTDVDGIVYNLPWQVHPDVLIETNGIVIFVRTTFGMEIEWHYRDLVTKISLTGNYQPGRVEGLCGNFDGDRTNDRNGQTTNGFAEGFRVVESVFPVQLPQFTPACFTILGTNDPPLSTCTTPQLDADAIQRCAIITSDSALQQCTAGERSVAVVSCQLDVCAKLSTPRAHCSSYAFAIHFCEDFPTSLDTGNWRTGPCADVGCPAGSVYSRTASACPLTCFDLITGNMSPCREKPREGCVCPDGYYWSGDECVLPDNCGCLSEGVYYKRDEDFYMPNCIQRCVCTSSGVQCSLTMCDANANCIVGANGRDQCICSNGFEGDGLTCTFIGCPNGCGTGFCGNQNGRQGCICPVGTGGQRCEQTQPGCFFRGDPHYTTFDGQRYDYQGECDYFLLFVTDIIIVTVRNEPFGNNGAAVAREVVIELRPGGVNPVTIYLRRNRQVSASGANIADIISLPYSDTEIEITDVGGKVRFSWNQGVEIEWNGIYDGAIYVTAGFIAAAIPTRSGVVGLCGNADGDPSNEFRLDGSPLTVDAFGDNLQSRELSDSNCEPTRIVGDPCATNTQFSARASAICNVIIDTNGPLGSCVGQFGADAQIYYSNCVFDICQTLPDENDPKICGTIQAFVHDCQQFNLPIGDWRATLSPATLCAGIATLQQPANTVFSPCTSLCPLTCTDVVSSLGVGTPPTCTTPCQEGYECLPGYYWHNGNCIPLAECPFCYDAAFDMRYDLGDSFSPPGCLQQCVCGSNQQITCSSAPACHCLAQCMLVGRSYECVCEPPFFVGNGRDCQLSSCVTNNPCVAPATCLTIPGTFMPYCMCPNGRFGNDCAFESRTCRAIGGELYFNYDREIELFYGQCTYPLTRVCDISRPDYFEVSVSLIDETSPAVPFTEANRISRIVVQSGLQSVTVSRTVTPDRFFIDGEEFTVAVLGDYEIVAWTLLDRVIVFLLRQGVIVSFTQTGVEVTSSIVPGRDLCGACGDQDGVIDGSSVFGGGCVNPPQPPQPCANLPAVSPMVQTQCNALLAHTGFTNCAAVAARINDCLAAGCANYPDASSVCAFVEYFNQECFTSVPITDFNFCVPQCPANSVFSLDIDSCPRTCLNQFPLPDCPVRPQSGCQCVGDRILNSMGDCVLPQDCGCLQFGVYYTVGQTYYTQGCDNLCTCQPNGAPTCISAQCPQGASCISPVTSVYECVCPVGTRLDNNACVPDPCASSPCANGATCTGLSETQFECCCLPGFDGVRCEQVLGLCKVYGNPYITTFDGNNYHFIGGGDSCEYQLATGSGCAGDTNTVLVQDFQLTASFLRGGSSTTAVLGSITFRAAGRRAIRIVQGGIILLASTENSNDFVQVYCPVELPLVRITCVYDSIILRFSFGLNIVWKEDYVFVYLNSDYALSTCGLCGNLNGNPNDDIQFGATVEEFADIFERAQCNLPTPVSNGLDLCAGATPAIVTQATEACSLLGDQLGPFGECIQMRPGTAASFATSCRHELCEFPPAGRTLCSTYEAFALYCRNQGFPVSDWRGPLNARQASVRCTFSCPVGTTYTTAMSSCPPSCALNPNIDRKRDCLTIDLEGCQCAPGLVLDNDRCISESACGCPYTSEIGLNSYLPVGMTVLNVGCTSQITCATNNNNNIAISPFNCPNGGVCIIDAFQRVCQCPPGFILVQGQCLVDPCNPHPCGLGQCITSDLVTGQSYCLCSPSTAGPNCAVNAHQCSVYGDPNFQTFDQESYKFRASSCEYYLLRNVIANHNVIITTEPVGTDLTRVNYVRVEEGGIASVEFRWDAADNIQVFNNGVLTTPPIDPLGVGAFSVVTGGISSYTTYISGGVAGFSVRVGSLRSVDVKYPNNNILSGLCGDGNGVALLTGAQQSVVNNFGENARVVGCLEPSPNPPAVVCNPARELVCSILDPASSNTGALQPCFAQVNVQPFYDACRTDLCASLNNLGKACAVIASYAQWCRDFNINIGNWRADTSCAITCPVNSVYNPTAAQNQPTCANPMPDPTVDPLPNVEGCTCLPGYLLDGDRCVLPAECGCIVGGFYFPRGSSRLTNNCGRVCDCPLTGVFSEAAHCRTTQCDVRASCNVVNGLEQCVCPPNSEGDGLGPNSCFPPGCGGNPCSADPGAVCETRPIPGQAEPDFFCRCSFGLIGQRCTISSNGVPTRTVTDFNFIAQSHVGFPTTFYQANDATFTQLVCPGATFMTLDIAPFATETYLDILFLGRGFPPVELTQLRDGAGMPVFPLGVDVEALHGVREPRSLILDTDSVWLYFVTNGAFEANGYRIDITCSSTTVPDNVRGNCYDGFVTRPNGVFWVLTPCETCVCNDGTIICARTDPQTLMNTLTSFPVQPVGGQAPEVVHGISCTADINCAADQGSLCVLPTCIGGCPLEIPSGRICSRGDSLRLCTLDPLCLSINFYLDPTQAPLNTNCPSFLDPFAPAGSCFYVECRTLSPTRKRSADTVTLSVVITTSSRLKQPAELDRDMRDLLATLPNDTARWVRDYDYILDADIHHMDKTIYLSGDNTGDESSGAENLPIDTAVTTPWTALLATLATVFLLIAVGLAVAIVSYYRKQSNSLNVKFEPAAPSYPQDNLPESLEMVKSERRDPAATVFARRIPLDDNTGNRENVFALSWARDDKDGKKPGKSQSDC